MKKTIDKEMLMKDAIKEAAIYKLKQEMDAIFNFDNYDALCAIRERLTPDSPLYFLAGTAPKKSAFYFKKKPTEQEIKKLTEELLGILKKCESCPDSIKRVFKEEMRQMDYPTMRRLYREITSARFIRKVCERQCGKDPKGERIIK